MSNGLYTGDLASTNNERCSVSPQLCELMRRLRYRRNNALLDNNTRFRGILEGLLGHELGSHRQSQTSLILRSALVLMGELRGEIPVVLYGCQK